MSMKMCESVEKWDIVVVNNRRQGCSAAMVFCYHIFPPGWFFGIFPDHHGFPSPWLTTMVFCDQSLGYGLFATIARILRKPQIFQLKPNQYAGDPRNWLKRLVFVKKQKKLSSRQSRRFWHDSFFHDFLPPWFASTYFFTICFGISQITWLRPHRQLLIKPFISWLPVPNKWWTPPTPCPILDFTFCCVVMTVVYVISYLTALV